MAFDRLGKNFLSLKFLYYEINSANKVAVDIGDQSMWFTVASLSKVSPVRFITTFWKISQHAKG